MTEHQCTAGAETAHLLRTGRRSSVRQPCPTCGRWSIWIERVDGAVVALDEKRGKRA